MRYRARVRCAALVASEVDVGGRSSGDLSAQSGASETRGDRVFVVSNTLPLKMREDAEAGKMYGHAYAFEADEESIYDQCREGALKGGQFEVVINVGQLPMEVPMEMQDAVANDLERRYNCMPVFLPKEVKENFYNGF